ncbi:hypothetical protein ACFRH6_23035 [Streptomyces sp. NPDC056749]|uniref:hypothetical protein n=1 Tax=Streptomyces sp. NPDC056749 TaxID=3345936 RepID=UPI0036A9C875
MCDPIQNTEVRGLLAAVLEALAIPYPATVGGGEVYDRLLAERAMHATTTLRGVLDHGDDPGWTADYLRARLAEHPPAEHRARGDTEAGR